MPFVFRIERDKILTWNSTTVWGQFTNFSTRLIFENTCGLIRAFNIALADFHQFSFYNAFEEL